MIEVPATEFTRSFGQYRSMAEREPVAITSHGRHTAYLISPAEFHELQRLKTYARRSRIISEMTRQEIEHMAAGRMAPEHRHLDALLDEDQTAR